MKTFKIWSGKACYCLLLFSAFFFCINESVAQGSSGDRSGVGAGGGQNEIGINVDWSANDDAKMLAKPSLLRWLPMKASEISPYLVVVKNEDIGSIVHVQYTREKSYVIPMDQLNMIVGTTYSVQVKSLPSNLFSKRLIFTIASQQEFDTILFPLKMQDHYYTQGASNQSSMEASVLFSSQFYYEAINRLMIYVEDEDEAKEIRELRDNVRDKAQINCVCKMER